MGDILGLVGKRLGLGLIILLVISVIIFFMVELLPGDIAQAVLGQGATEENVRALRKEMGLDKPAIVRYLEWLSGAVVFDFGNSIVTGESVAETIGDRFMNTLFLAAYAAVIAVPVSIVLGVIVALLRNSIFDRVANVVSLSFISRATTSRIAWLSLGFTPHFLAHSAHSFSNGGRIRIVVSSE